MIISIYSWVDCLMWFIFGLHAGIGVAGFVCLLVMREEDE